MDCCSSGGKRNNDKCQRCIITYIVEVCVDSIYSLTYSSSCDDGNIKHGIFYNTGREKVFINVWIDITNSLHVIFYNSIIQKMIQMGYEVTVMATDYV